MNKKRNLSILWMCICLCVFFTSCKKTDFSEHTTSPRNIEKEFFDASQTTNPIVLRIIDKIKSDNEKFHFVNDFVLREGFAKWSKAMVLPKKSGSTYRDNAEGNSGDTVILIPIVPDQLSIVKDILSCVVSGDSIYASLIKSEEYINYGYEQNNQGKPTAKDVSFLFMTLEKSVFDKSFFDITDTSLAKKIFGDNVTPLETHLILDKDAEGKVNIYKVAPPHYIDIGGVTVIGYLPANMPIDLDYLLMLLNSGSGGSSGTPGAGGGWWPSGGQQPSGGPGGGTGNPGGSPTTTTPPGWTPPPCGVGRMANVFYRYNCPPSLPDDIPGMLHDFAVAIKTASDGLFQTANTLSSNGNKVEWSHIIVKNTSGTIYAKNPKTDGDPDDVTFNWYLTADETLLGAEHTHQSESSNLTDRPGPDDGDVLKMRQHRNTLGFTSFINCGNVKYALVIENTGLFSTWANQFVMPAQEDILDSTFQANTHSNPNYSTNYQLAQVQTLIALMGGVGDHGIGIYQSNNPEMTNFIKLN